MAYVTPTKAGLLAAFTRHGLRYRVEPVVAGAEGRPWIDGIRAVVNHHTAGKSSLGLLMNRGGRYPTVNALIDRDGLVHILSTLSVWGSGDGGPWPGVAAKDSLHLVGWQTEVEDMGLVKSFTPEQMESLGRMTAALVSLGVPLTNVINHRDWTDGTAPVGGFPLPTRGRKVDTRYTTSELRDNARKYEIRKDSGVTKVTAPWTYFRVAPGRAAPRIKNPTRFRGFQFKFTETRVVDGELWLKTERNSWVLAARTAFKG